MIIATTHTASAVKYETEHHTFRAQWIPGQRGLCELQQRATKEVVYTAAITPEGRIVAEDGHAGPLGAELAAKAVTDLRQSHGDPVPLLLAVDMVLDDLRANRIPSAAMVAQLQAARDAAK